MPRVELIYDKDCPNIERAREVLLEAFRESGRAPSWREWDRKSPDSPDYASRYGSPTILVDGREVTGTAPVEDADSCRIYDHGAGGLTGVPPVETIVRALRSSDGRQGVRYASRSVSGSEAVATELPAAGGSEPRPACVSQDSAIIPPSSS